MNVEFRGQTPSDVKVTNSAGSDLSIYRTARISYGAEDKPTAERLKEFIVAYNSKNDRFCAVEQKETESEKQTKSSNFVGGFTYGMADIEQIFAVPEN